MKNARDLIDDYIKKSMVDGEEFIWRPKGTVDWRLPTGVLSLDAILGGGLPSGFIVQIYGKEISGKSTLVNSIIASAVDIGLKTVVLPLEGYDKEYFNACGVDTEADNFDVVAAEWSEHIYNLIHGLLRQSDAQVIIIDSIMASASKAVIGKKQAVDDLDKKMGVGISARLISDFISKIRQPVIRKPAILVIVNQVRTEINPTYSAIKPPGGYALQHSSDLKINMWGKLDKEKGHVTSNVTIMKAKNSKIKLLGNTELVMIHGKGIDKEQDLITVGYDLGFIKKGGAWYTFSEDMELEGKWQGKEKFAKYLKDNKEIFDRVYNRAMEIVDEKEIDFFVEDFDLEEIYEEEEEE